MSRTAERNRLTAAGTVPVVTVLKRPPFSVVIGAIAVIAVALAGFAGWQFADRTQPGLCMVEQGGECVYEMTPRRGDRVTVRLDMEHVKPRGEWTVPAACLLPGKDSAALLALGCPDWMVNWDRTQLAG